MRAAQSLPVLCTCPWASAEDGVIMCTFIKAVGALVREASSSLEEARGLQHEAKLLRGKEEPAALRRFVYTEPCEGAVCSNR